MVSLESEEFGKFLDILKDSSAVEKKKGSVPGSLGL